MARSDVGNKDGYYCDACECDICNSETCNSETLREALLAEGFFERVCFLPEETRAVGMSLGELARRRGLVGRRLGACLGAVFLFGGVGAGKTVFSSGFARGLGVAAHVTSPTYVVGAAYDIPGGGVFHHFDAYRLNGPHEMDETGFWDYLGDRDCVVAVEWAERLGGSVDDEPRIEIAITPVDEITVARRVRITLKDGAYENFGD